MKNKIKTMYKALPKYETFQDVFNTKTNQPGIIAGIAHVNRKGEQCYYIKWNNDTTSFVPEDSVTKMIAAYENYFAEKHKFLKHLRKKLGPKRYNSMIRDVFSGQKSTKELMGETSQAIKDARKRAKAS